MKKCQRSRQRENVDWLPNYCSVFFGNRGWWI